MSAPACSPSPGYNEPNPGCPSLVQQGECWPNVAPCGVTQFEQIVNTDNLGVAFSENAWATAQQEGCLGCPQRYVDPAARQFPKWPEPAVYQQLDTPSQFITGTDPDMGIDETPYLQERVMAQVYNNPSEFADPQAFPVQPMLPSLPQIPMPPAGSQPYTPPKHTPYTPSNPYSTPPGPEAGSSLRTSVPPKQLPAKHPLEDPATIVPFVGYGLRGIGYHLSHFSQIPRDSFWGKMKFVFIDEDRWKALVAFIVITFLGAAFLYILFHPPRPSSQGFSQGPSTNQFMRPFYA